jgi:small subunit ribosomal protein S17
MTETEQNVNEEQAPEAAAEAPTGQPTAEPAAASPDPAEQLSPKERRKLARSAQTGDAAPQRSAEERARERAEQRRQRARRRRPYRRRMRERRRSEGPRAEPLAPEPRSRGVRKVREGVVVSDKADKTITVRIDVARPHRMYKKVVRTSSTLHAHDEENAAHVGDTVRVIESRPLSRTKRWRLVEVLERAR